MKHIAKEGQIVVAGYVSVDKKTDSLVVVSVGNRTERRRNG